MVTLVNVELFGQGVLALDKNGAAGLLVRFLIALPIGALLGGWIATKIGDRIVAFVGLVIAAGGYWLISKWPVDVLAARHDLGLFTLPTLDTDLAIAGLGLGLVIAPLTSATLRVVPAAQHGIASAVGGGGPDDRHADRYRGAERLGSVPLQSAPGQPAQRRREHPGRAAGCRRRPASARPTSCSTARSSASPRSSAWSAPCSAC